MTTTDKSTEHTMVFERSTIVNAPLAAVKDFHSHVDGFKALMPPGIPVKMHTIPEPIVDGDRLDFTMWLGPMPVYFESFIEMTDSGFLDVQGQGPFALWEHTHTFEAIAPSQTRIHDRIHARLSTNPLKLVQGILMWIGLPVLFIWRYHNTKRHLEVSK